MDSGNENHKNIDCLNNYTINFVAFDDSYSQKVVIYFLSKEEITMNYIKDLYYGNISPSAQKFVKGSEYAKHLNSNDKLRDQLKASISSEDIKIVDKICENYSNLISISSEDNYASGFRDGAKLMLDTLIGENKNLKIIPIKNA